MSLLRTALICTTLPFLLTTTPLLAQSTEGDDAATETTETEAPQEPGSDLSLGEPVSTEPQAGQTYTAETFTDWELRCVRTDTGNDPCQLYQLLQDEQGNSVAEFTIFPLPEGGQAAAGATVITPLETLLTAQLRLTVDGGQTRRYPFAFCSAIGCFSRLGFTAPEVAAFRAGNAATLTINPAAAPDQEVNLTLSLAGFTAGFEAAQESQRGAASE